MKTAGPSSPSSLVHTSVRHEKETIYNEIIMLSIFCSWEVTVRVGDGDGKDVCVHRCGSGSKRVLTCFSTIKYLVGMGMVNRNIFRENGRKVPDDVNDHRIPFP